MRTGVRGSTQVERRVICARMGTRVGSQSLASVAPTKSELAADNLQRVRVPAGLSEGPEAKVTNPSDGLCSEVSPRSEQATALYLVLGSKYTRSGFTSRLVSSRTSLTAGCAAFSLGFVVPTGPPKFPRRTFCATSRLQKGHNFHGSTPRSHRVASPMILTRSLVRPSVAKVPTLTPRAGCHLTTRVYPAAAGRPTYAVLFVTFAVLELKRRDHEMSPSWLEPAIAFGAASDLE